MNKKEFKTKVEKANIKQLTSIGFKKYDTFIDENKHKKTLMLIPKELFNSIPEGFNVVDIFGKKEKFSKEKSDTDHRFGCLPYGVFKSGN